MRQCLTIHDVYKGTKRPHIVTVNGEKKKKKKKKPATTHYLEARAQPINKV